MFRATIPNDSTFYELEPWEEGSSKTAAFSLIELLLVIVIMAIIMAFVSPAVTSLLRGSYLAQAAQIVSSQLALAQQTALAKNHTVEVRLYQFSDPATPGESAGDASRGKYRAIQVFELLPSGSAVAASKSQRLPSSIIIDSGNTLSSIIASASGSTPAAPVSPALSNGASLSVSIPQVGTAYNCVAFHFHADGSTDLPTNSKWFLTLHNMIDGDQRQQPPANYVTLQIAPSNGHIQTFRP